MALKRYFKTIYHWLWLIITLSVVTTASVALYSWELATPKYQGTTTILVNQQQSQLMPSSSMYDSVLANQALVKTYSDIMESSSILTELINEVHLPYTVPQLQKLISVSSSGQSQVIHVTVTTPSMQQSVDIANTLVHIFQDRVTSLMDVENVQIVDPAVMPNKITPISPKKAENLVLAFALGIIIGIGVAFVMEYLDDTIKSENDVRELLELPILGTVAKMPNYKISFKSSLSPLIPQPKGD